MKRDLTSRISEKIKLKWCCKWKTQLNKNFTKFDDPLESNIRDRRQGRGTEWLSKDQW